MKKQELTRRIYKYNVPLKTLKYSYLYLLAIEKKDAQGNILERYVKFGPGDGPDAPRTRRF